MSGEAMVELCRQALYLAALLITPPVAAAALAGLVVSALQTATQVQEPTVGFAVRAAAVVGALIAAGPWIGVQLGVFTDAALAAIATVAR